MALVFTGNIRISGGGAQIIPSTYPSAAYINSITQVTTGSISVSWTPTSVGGTWGICGYNINSFPTGVSVNVPKPATTATTSTVISGLSTTVYHTVIVTPYNYAGFGSQATTSSMVYGSLQGGVGSGGQIYSTPGTYSWIPPAGVDSVSVVAIGGGGGSGGTDSSYFSTSSLVAGLHGGNAGVPSFATLPGGSFVGQGGGSGGSGGASGFSNQAGGGGGAGGYSCNGGAGAATAPTAPGSAVGSAANSGSGGGGGGASYTNVSSNQLSIGAGGGGGVGLFGKGSDGTGGTIPGGGGGGGSGGSSGTAGTDGAPQAPRQFGPGGLGGAYGGGLGGTAYDTPFALGVSGGGGGGLGYYNNYPVTPGTSYTVQTQGNGAVRIVWPGNKRLFPSTGVSAINDSSTYVLSTSSYSLPTTPPITASAGGSGIIVTISSVTNTSTAIPTYGISVSVSPGNVSTTFLNTQTTSLTNSTGTVQFSVASLQPGFLYTITAQSYNAVGYGPVVSTTLSAIAVSSVLVAGGGGASVGGGGGGGFLSTPSSVLLRNVQYQVTIGGGGANASTPSPFLNLQGSNGGNSTFGPLIAFGGGGGGGQVGPAPTGDGLAGGSGGGAGRSVPNAAGAIGAGTPGQGYAGGSPSFPVCNSQYGGGGGAGRVGGNATGSPRQGGLGGTGTYTTIVIGSALTALGVGQYFTATGYVYFAGGGAGGAGGIPTPSIGGTGGGGAGAPFFCGTALQSGAKNSGGGGGGNYNSNAGGGCGGSGIVMISHSNTYTLAVTTGSGVTITSSGSNTVYIFTSSGSITF